MPWWPHYFKIVSADTPTSTSANPSATFTSMATITSFLSTIPSSIASSTPTASSNSQGTTSRAKKIGAGIGGGLGGAAVLALIALGFCVHSRKNSNGAIGPTQVTPSASDNKTAHKLHSKSRMSELSGYRDPSELASNPCWSELSSHREHAVLPESEAPVRPSSPIELSADQAKSD